MNKSLNQKTILITGSKGVAHSLALEIVQEGGKVIIFDNDSKSLNLLKKKITKLSDNSEFYCVDFKNFQKLKRILNEVSVLNKVIDGFVAYAGITYFGSILDTNEKLFDEFINVNLKSNFFITQFILKKMIDQNTKGSFVYIGSPHYKGGEIDRAPYSLTKGALNTLSQHVYKNYASYNIRSNYIIMGWTLTEGELKLREKNGLSRNQIEKIIKRKVPSGESCRISDLVSGIMFLLSDFSISISGSTIDFSGGLNI